MNPREKGFLLLTSHLGDPQRRVLSPAQMRLLAQRAGTLDGSDAQRELTRSDLVALGYSREMSAGIVSMLEDEALLERYLRRGSMLECTPVTRVSPEYPRILRQRLGLDSPGCLWIRGERELLNAPGVSLVGSRELREENRAFAVAVGRQAAAQGLVLVSGNARGADRAAQEACLAAGGKVISIVADDLSRQPKREGVLYVSEDGFDEPFSAQRALSRNRCIHALGQLVFVAQCTLGKGGTWDGTVKNLRFQWSPVAACRDGSQAMAQLEQMGAYLIGREELADFGGFSSRQLKFFDP